MFQLIKRTCCLKFQIANVHETNIKKQPPEVLYKKAVPKSLPIFAGNTCAGAFFYWKYKASVLGRYWKEVPAQVFFCEYYETFKNNYFEKICERLLLNNLKRDYSFIHENCKIVVKGFSTFAGKHLYQSVLFVNINAAWNLSLSLFKKRLPRRCFLDSYPKFLTTTFLAL